MHNKAFGDQAGVGAYSAPQTINWIQGGRFAAGKDRERGKENDKGRRQKLDHPALHPILDPPVLQCWCMGVDA